MAEQKSIIVEPIIVNEQPKGTRNNNNLKSAFYASPIYNNELTDAERFETFIKLTKGVIINGNGINSFDTRYNGNDQNQLPNLTEVETGGGGLPSTPYTPNITAPGPGSLNAVNQPAYEGEFKDPKNVFNFGSGLNGLTSPSETSSKIAGQTTLGNYIMGRSYQGSDGKA